MPGSRVPPVREHMRKRAQKPKRSKRLGFGLERFLKRKRAKQRTRKEGERDG